MGNVIPFNPLDKKNLAISVGNALMHTDARPFNELDRFEGSGVYSLYYRGNLPFYDPLARANRIECVYPIYVGKADSKGKRKGGFLENGTSGTALYSRLCDHAKSLMQATNLDIRDFLFRFLVVGDLWISLGESLLISKYAPVWNKLVEGFGNHDPGKGRHQGMRPLWDMLHPGRPWAERLRPNLITAEQISSDVLQYLVERYSDVKELPKTIHYEMTELGSEA